MDRVRGTYRVYGGRRSRFLPLKLLDIDASTMKIQREKLAPVFFRPLVAQVDHRSRMGVATAQ